MQWSDPKTLSLSFNAPKGSAPAETVLSEVQDLSEDEFQCPEGLGPS